MGLDTVELVMELEDEFDLNIPDDVAAVLTTPGQVSDYLIAALGGRAALTGVCSSACSFYRLRQQLMARFGTPRAAVRPGTSIGELVPGAGRRAWRAIADGSGLRREPNVLFQSRFPPPTRRSTS